MKINMKKKNFVPSQSPEIVVNKNTDKLDNLNFNINSPDKVIILILKI